MQVAWQGSTKRSQFRALKWDHVDLPSHFAVWAATKEARFLHGRVVWSKWDVDEMIAGEFREKLEAVPYFMRVGIRGW
ncbi:hypothetical protein BKA56DRAFT_533135 [Ilyonectria sp. MPI-CAGE-AT-0026]|nr:hypothetical protein BKA56DRAFT_533135 [Ilyonectria sp. MPI-CAGE-AT-0026]